jgi:hypothetical protein
MPRHHISPLASPMTGSGRGIQYAEASRINHCLWNTGSPPSRVMTIEIAATALRSRRRFARGLLRTSRHPMISAQGMPGARCARSRARSVESTRVSHHGQTGNTRHSPHSACTAISCSPPERAFLPRHRRDAKHHRQPSASVGASGPHDLAPSASCAVVYRAINVHRTPPHVRDHRKVATILFLPCRQAKIRKVRSRHSKPTSPCFQHR